MVVKIAPRLGSGAEGYDHRVGIVNFDRMRKERLGKAKAAMKEHGIAAALLFRPENIRYATSTMYLDFISKLRYALIFIEYDPILFEPFGNPVGECPWIKPENCKLSLHWADQSPGVEASWDVARRFAAGIKSELKEKGLEKEKLGVDELDELARCALMEAGIEMINVMPVMLEARAVKTQDEINCLHMAAVMADSAHYAMLVAIKPGIRERDVVAVGMEALVRSGAESNSRVHVSTKGKLGGRSMNADKVIQFGDIVTVDIYRATYMGYNTCYYRNYVVGREPTEKEKNMHKMIYERIYKVIDALKPGANTGDVAKHWVSAVDRGLPAEEYRWCEDLGHGLGLGLYEYPIINRLWSLKHPQLLKTGMTLAVEALEDDPEIGRMKLEEMVAITDSGVEIFTRMPVKDMIVANPIVTVRTD